MNNIRTDRRLSRRDVLTGTALALGAPISPAAAQQKLTQADASCQGTLRGDQRCALCFNFLQPSGCKFVQGNISPAGWCQLFALRTST